MFKPTQDNIDDAIGIVAEYLPVSCGYRIIIKALPSTSGLKAGEVKKFETLGNLGIITQSEDQTERESRGSHAGILCYVGDGAFSGLSGTPWAKEGDVILFNKYAGTRIDVPPGSGDFYHFCNDEDIIGRYEVKL